MSIKIPTNTSPPPTTCWCCKNHLAFCMCWARIGPDGSEHCEPSDHIPKEVSP